MEHPSDMPKKSREMRPGRLAALLLTPSFLVVFVVTVLPILLALGMSFTEASVQAGGVKWDWVGWDNYVRFLTRGSFWESIRVTSFFTFVSLIIELVLGTLSRGPCPPWSMPACGPGFTTAILTGRLTAS